MRSWSSPSVDATDTPSASLARRFVEASRRAEIVALVNSARNEREIAAVAVDEFSEAFDAELVFVVVSRGVHGGRETIGYTGMTAERAGALSSDSLSSVALGATRAEVHAGEDLLALGAYHLAVSPWRATDGREVVIGVGRLYDEPFDSPELALLEAVTSSVGHGLERAWLSAERDRQAAREAALARAARSVSASLDGRSVLETLAREVAHGLEADVVAVYEPGAHGHPRRLIAGVGLETEAGDISDERSWPGSRLCALAARTGHVMVHQPNEQRPLCGQDGDLLLRSGAAAPIRPRGASDGVVLVAYHGERWLERADLDLLAAFAELGAVACRNAADLAAAQQAALLDSLTGLANHGAFQDRLREELNRAERDGNGLALVLMDLNDFKLVNDTFGHVVGDALLRAVADALRMSVRTYDQVARYGGDEFAILLPSTDADTARRVLDRALNAIAAIDLPVPITVSASAGLAQWHPPQDASALVEEADGAMFESKRARQRALGRPEGRRSADEDRADGREGQQLRRLTAAAGLGARLGRLVDQRSIVETAIIELGSALGYDSSTLVRCSDGDELRVVATGTAGHGGEASRKTSSRGEDPVTTTLRRCVFERRTVLEGERGGDGARTVANGSETELAVPIYAGEALWGALGVRTHDAVGLDAYDVQVLQGVADQLGSALRTAELHAELGETHVATAAALAAALAAKDRYTADHARSIADLAVAVGRRLGMDAAELSDLHYGAIFHDIGKIAVPDAILNKPAPLDESELAILREHPKVGEQILAPLPFLAGVREIVRHDHERWDGAGYPDGLASEDIPLGARIVLVVDAYHAMRTDRPYRLAMPDDEARRELVAHAGSQFDPRIVGAFLAVLEDGAPGAGTP